MFIIFAFPKVYHCTLFNIGYFLYYIYVKYVQYQQYIYICISDIFNYIKLNQCVYISYE